MIKVGIAGLGRGRSFFAFNTMPDFKVVAICDIDEERLEIYGKQYNVQKRYVKFEDMINCSGVDLVVVATPIMFHAEQSIKALEAGIDVISEVPAATTFDECYMLVEAVEKSGRRYMMGENCCYIKENVLLKRLVEAGKFGELYFGEGEYIHKLKRHRLYNPDGSLTWRGRIIHERNGNIYPTHSLGPLYQMFKERVVSVCCLGSGVHTIPDAKLEDSVITLCKTESGKLIKLRLDIVSNRPLNPKYYAIQGTKGCYEAPRGLGDSHKVWFVDDCEEDEWRPLSDYEEEYLPKEYKELMEEASRSGHWGSDYFMIRDFAESILYNRKPPIDVYDSLNMTAPGIASEISIAQNGRPIEVPDFRK